MDSGKRIGKETSKKELYSQEFPVILNLIWRSETEGRCVHMDAPLVFMIKSRERMKAMLKRKNKEADKKREKAIEKLIKKMTLDEKITMIHGATLFNSGAVERLGIPAIVTSDGPMGVRAEFMADRWLPAGNQDDMVSYLPSNSDLASSWNTELAHTVG